jgi:hypothetical protein
MSSKRNYNLNNNVHYPLKTDFNSVVEVTLSHLLFYILDLQALFTLILLSFRLSASSPGMSLMRMMYRVNA